MSDERIAEALFSGALCFDPTQDQSPHSNDPQGVLSRFMLESRDLWTYEREICATASMRLASGFRVILHGEKGSGKSTVLHSLSSATAHSANSAQSIFILCDFNQETLEADFDTTHSPERAVAEYVEFTLSTALATPTMAASVERELDILLLRRSAHFSEVQRHLIQLGRPAMWISATTFSELLQENEELEIEWNAARNAYLHGVSPFKKTVDRFRALLRSGVSATIAIDNIDQLSPEIREYVAKAALGLASLDEKRLGIIVACRTPHVTELVTRFDTGRAWETSAMPYPTSDTWDIAKILELRIETASDPELVSRLKDQRLISDTISYAQALDIAQAKVRVAMAELWDTHPRPGTDQRAELAAALVAWHNGNIRNVSQSVVDLGYSSKLDPTHLGVSHPATRRRARNRVYRHILTSRSAVGGSEASVLHSSLGLFVASPEATTPHRPFYFLTYRLLAHLLHRRGAASLGTIAEVFEAYGVQLSSVTDALNRLGKREGYDTGLIRFEGLEGQRNSLTEDDLEVFVEILPSGTYVVKDLVTKCEYLYWAAIELNDLDAPIADATGLRRDGLKSETVTNINKVLVSTAMLRHYLMPRFEREHPYMAPGASFIDRDAARLKKFERDFGYQKDNWFIKRVRQSIIGHAIETEVMETLPSQVKEDWDYVKLREAKLDRILDAAAGDHL